MPRVARERGDFLRLMAARRVPLMLYYIADRAAARINDAMFVSMLPIATMLKNEPTITIAKYALLDTGMIAGFPAAAFDLHTSEGRSAMNRFGRECRPVANIVDSLSASMRDTAVRHAVFIAEGGTLAEQLLFTDADRIESDAHAAELAFTGLNPNEQQHLICMVRAELPTLNFHRRHAFASAF